MFKFCLFLPLVINRKRGRRANDEPLLLSVLKTIYNGYVPRDYLNLELRHHHILFIVFMLCLVLFLIYGDKGTHNYLNLQIFPPLFLYFDIKSAILLSYYKYRMQKTSVKELPIRSL